MSRQAPAQPSPQTGPVLLTSDSDAGTAQLPAGYSARWDPAASTVCVDGSVGDSGVRHVSEVELAATMETGVSRRARCGPVSRRLVRPAASLPQDRRVVSPPRRR